MTTTKLRIAYQLLDAACVSLAPTGRGELRSPEYNALFDLRACFEHDYPCLRSLRLNGRAYARLHSVMNDERIDSLREIGDEDFMKIPGSNEFKEIKTVTILTQAGACPHCGRVEIDEGNQPHWYTPCPSDDCPSHKEHL